jgi:hypothetical protein
MVKSLLTLAWVLLIGQPALAQVILILAPNGDFLGGVALDGRLCSSHDPNCIWNPYSNYGSQYSSQSIFNNYGEYGSPYSSTSICNLNISYEEIPFLVEIKNRQTRFYDVIGPDSETLLGANIYTLACGN